MISIPMLKLCNKSICKPLNIIFKSCLTEGIFPSQWKKASIVRIHQKNDKDCVKNYSLSSPNLKQSFRAYYLQHDAHIFQSNSCVNQLLAITHEIFPSFNDNHEVRAVFLDISKVFDKLWFDSGICGIIHKLKRNWISGNLLSLSTKFLRNR